MVKYVGSLLMVKSKLFPSSLHSFKGICFSLYWHYCVRGSYILVIQLKHYQCSSMKAKQTTGN